MKPSFFLLAFIILCSFPSFGQTCSGTAAINYQQWNGISGTAVSNLTSNVNYPNNPSLTGTKTTFEMPNNLGNNFGVRMNGFICPPLSGSYVFWIASDESAELWLSTTNSAANKIKIAFNTSSTNSRQWTKYTSQKSVAVSLLAGQLYYVEALMKEGAGQDNLAVGWAKPGQPTTAPSEVIPGTYLRTTLPDGQAPTAPTNLSSIIIAQTGFTLKWTASTDNVGVAGYDVYRNNIKINASNITGTSYNVTGLSAATSYTFNVVARDAAGNQSAASTGLLVTTLVPGTPSESFTMRTVIANQRMPHDLVYGPDNNIWYTERFAGTVSFVNPQTGAKTIVLTLGSAMVRAGGQDGLLGLALHPQFLTGKPYVYISYTYESTSLTVRKTRIARYTYNFNTQVLEFPQTILENIPGSNDHNSARIAIGPDLKLYYSVGDMGAGQFDNATRTQNAQNINVYEGKILRLNTELVGGSWIPADNPFQNAGQPTAVYTWGHRNPQGLVWGAVNGVNMLYSSEHGPYSDDEVNVIQVGRNYGWPNVIGWCDGNYNGRTTGNYTIVDEQANCNSLNVKEPLRSLFPSTNPPAGGDNMLWPSTAPSGTDFYGSTAIPGWQNSLLIAELKKGAVARLKLSSDGLSIISDTINYFQGLGRFRDVVVSPDGLKIYVACDSSGSTSGPTGNVTTTPANPGSILEFTFQPAPANRYNQRLITENLQDKSIDVYPNPASTFIIVYNYNNATDRMISLVDLSGRIIRQMKATSISSRIETTGLANGMYILRVTDSKSKLLRTEKIVIQH